MTNPAANGWPPAHSSSAHSPSVPEPPSGSALWCAPTRNESTSATPAIFRTEQSCTQIPDCRFESGTGCP